MQQWPPPACTASDCAAYHPGTLSVVAAVPIERDKLYLGRRSVGREAQTSHRALLLSKDLRGNKAEIASSCRSLPSYEAPSNDVGGSQSISSTCCMARAGESDGVIRTLLALVCCVAVCAS